MKITCIAIDDEPLALDIIKDYCSKVPFLDLVRTFDNGIESIDYFKKNPVDLMFLDIQMEELTGIQLLNILKPQPLVIFTTAYDSYALQGFELDVVDYLLKPIPFERFLKAVNKASEIIESGKQPLKNKNGDTTIQINRSKNEYFFVKTEYRLEKIMFDDILYIEGMGDYLRIATSKKKLMTLQSFKKIEEMLPEENFIRVHKSYIVAIDKIETIERNRIHIADQHIPISETYRTLFFKMLDKKKLD